MKDHQLGQLEVASVAGPFDTSSGAMAAGEMNSAQHLRNCDNSTLYIWIGLSHMDCIKHDIQQLTQESINHIFTYILFYFSPV